MDEIGETGLIGERRKVIRDQERLRNDSGSMTSGIVSVTYLGESVTVKNQGNSITSANINN